MENCIDKITALNGLAEEIRGCKKCELCQFRKNAVVGEGNPYTDIMFVGEAPGRTEDETGRPFVGNAGKFLDSMLNAAGLSRENVFITNVIKDRPPENRDPKPEEISNCQTYLERQIDIIDPKIVVTLGRFSMNLFLPGVKISKVHGIPYIKRDGRVYVPMYHPAATLHQPSLKETAIKDMLKLPKIIEILEKGKVTEESDRSVSFSDISVPEVLTEEEELASVMAVSNVVEEEPEIVIAEEPVKIEETVNENHVVINRPHMRCFDPYFFAMSIPDEIIATEDSTNNESVNNEEVEPTVDVINQDNIQDETLNNLKTGEIETFAETEDSVNNEQIENVTEEVLVEDDQIDTSDEDIQSGGLNSVDVPVINIEIEARIEEVSIDDIQNDESLKSVVAEIEDNEVMIESIYADVTEPVTQNVQNDISEKSDVTEIQNDEYAGSESDHAENESTEIYDTQKDEEAYISEMIENASNSSAILDTELEYVADENAEVTEPEYEENTEENLEDEIITEIYDTNKFQLKLFDD